MSFIFITYIVASSVLCYWLCGKLITFLNSKNILDTPNHRSNHIHPTPTGGGIAILFSFFMGSAPFVFFYSNAVLAPSLLMLALSALTLISFRDDIKEVSIGIRLISHILIATLGAMVVLQNGSVFMNYLPYSVEFCLITLMIAGFINLFNFMDGIDGMTGMETIFLSLSLALGFYITDVQFSYIYISLLLAGCTAGFLKYNWHPAKLFIGDAGSVSIGFIIATLLCIWAAKGYQAQALILPMYYFADAGVVLFMRIVRLEKFWLPHTKHFFQIAVRSGSTHTQVVLKVLQTNIMLLVVCLASIHARQINLHLFEYICIFLSVIICVALVKSLQANKSQKL